MAKIKRYKTHTYWSKDQQQQQHHPEMVIRNNLEIVTVNKTDYMAVFSL